MFRKISEIDKKYSNTFFLISLFIIILFLVYISFNNKVREKTCKIPNDVVGGITSYTYKIKYIDNDDSYEVYVSKYDDKYLFEKNYNDEKYVYYLHYTDFLERKSNGSFGKLSNNYIIDKVDNKLLLVDYLNDLSLESTVSTLSERTCYINVKNDLTMCINLDNSIELEKDDYKLIYTIIDKNNVNDFNVYIDLDYVDEKKVEEDYDLS